MGGVSLGPFPGLPGSAAEGRSAASGALQPVGRLLFTGGVCTSENSLLFYKEFAD